MAIDFSAYFDLNYVPEKKQEDKVVEIKKLDTSIYKKNKGKPVDFGIEIAPESTVVIDEVWYRDSITVLENSDIEHWLLFGSPMF